MGTPTTIPGEVRPESDCPDGASLVTLHYHRTFTLPVGTVWSMFASPEGLDEWFGTYTGDPASGRVRLTTHDDVDSATTDVRILRCAPPTALAVDLDGWLLEIALRASGPVTALEFRHRHVPRSEVGEVGPGWQYYLDRLDAALRHVRPPRWLDYLDLVDEYR
ncbi:SRPBCC domain-containing protein [Rhodococcus sp. Z13]|uniref:SRPBCC domain-containing protein n=1 Tax=Rhodococcus sacchari TaxID=2962047 RepID=A0ACD4DL59_9NOCA|nr:SRPBCC domain-containing protein [Rhodococcus sp. Z13]UYP20774.1 SRPBCC domain-containing protein [Rhodococcus sp. Z13]